MSRYGLQIQEVLANHARNYNKSIYQIFKPYIKNNVLEIGCAIGNITKFFLDRELIIAVDISKEYVDFVKKKFLKFSNFRAFKYDASDENICKLKKYNVDSIVCFNVLEHVKDDNKALRNFNKILNKKGTLCLLVPAIKWLYGTMDRADNHFRRYSKKELKFKLEKNGFRIKKMRYVNFIGAFGWFLNGKILKKNVLPGIQLGLYDKLIPFIFKFERLFGPPFGLSLICICEKK